MTLKEYLHDVRQNPSKYAHIEQLVIDAEIQRERDESAAYNELHNGHIGKADAQEREIAGLIR